MSKKAVQFEVIASRGLRRFGGGMNIFGGCLLVCFVMSRRLASTDVRRFSCYTKEFEANDLLIYFVEFSNVHNSDTSFDSNG